MPMPTVCLLRAAPANCGRKPTRRDGGSSIARAGAVSPATSALPCAGASLVTSPAATAVERCGTETPPVEQGTIGLSGATAGETGEWRRRRRRREGGLLLMFG